MCRDENQRSYCAIPVPINEMKLSILTALLTHSHTMTPFDASGKQAF